MLLWEISGPSELSAVAAPSHFAHNFHIIPHMIVFLTHDFSHAMCRLAAFLCGFEIFQITVRSGYGVADFKADLLSLYTKTGVKSTPVVFILTDNQIIDEKFLVYINDLLSTGYIADLCTQVSFAFFSFFCTQAGTTASVQGNKICHVSVGLKGEHMQ